MLKNRVAIFAFFLWGPNIYSTIGIMGALEEEIKLINEAMRIVKVDTFAGRIFYKGVYQNEDIVLVKAGIGKVNAALTAQLLIDKFSPTLLIFTGIAGAIHPTLLPGDIVISTQLTYHDFGTITPKGLSLFDFTPIEADPHLIKVAEKVAKGIEFDTLSQSITGKKATLPRIFLAPITTGDQFIASESKRRWLYKKLGAYAVEMEGCAVAQVCEANGVPFVIIRSISDLANEEARIDIKKFILYAAYNSALIVKGMIKELSR